MTSNNQSRTSQHALIEQIIDDARWCPSPDNIQAWQFNIVDEHTFTVSIREQSDWMVYDINGHVTWLTLGLLFECIEIAASVHQCLCQFEKISSDVPLTLTYRVSLIYDQKVQSDALYHALLTRTVQRSPMSSRKLTDDEKSRLLSVIPDDFKLHWYESFSEKYRIGKLLYGFSTTRYAMKEGYDVHSKVIDWRKGFERFSPIKIPPLSLGVDRLTIALTKWALASWSRFHFLEKYLGGTIWAKLMMDFVNSLRCGGHFILTYKKPVETLDEFILSGKVVMRLWLTCQQLNLRFQPTHTPVMFSELVRNNTPYTKDERAINNTLKMARYFEQITTPTIVQQSVFMARVGEAPQPTARSTRKSTQELIQ
jgi:hypothetical protein